MKNTNNNFILAFIVFIVSLLLVFNNIRPSLTPLLGEDIEKYLRSQDIDFDVKPRAHISDSEIYRASGFLYFLGAPPTSYNFQHPPVIKYFFGASEVILGNALYVQFIFGVALVMLTFYLGMKTFESAAISLSASVLLIFDPLFRELTRSTLLDLGQAVFALAYFILAIHYHKKANTGVLAGVLLGLFAGAKFWSSAIVFLLMAEVFIFLKSKKIEKGRIFATLTTAFLVFNAFYAVSYFNSPDFNILFWQAKMAKFMLHHDVATALGANLILFLTGNYSAWWAGEMLRDTWSFVWPLSFLVSLFAFIKQRKEAVKSFHLIFPILYLFSLSTQAPFSRYFILVLPFLYLNLAFLIRKVIVS